MTTTSVRVGQRSASPAIAATTSATVARQRAPRGGGVGGDAMLPPFRDDPNAPASWTRLESVTSTRGSGSGGGGGGLGSTGTATTAVNYVDGTMTMEEKSKDGSLGQRIWRGIVACCRCCWRVESDWCYPSNNRHLQPHRRRQHDDTAQSTMEYDDDEDGVYYYYEDSFNDLPWSCRAGTTDEDGIWLNRSDLAGTIMSLMVWVLLMYSAWTMSWLAHVGGVPVLAAVGYNVTAALALACHAKTTLTDPGAVPASAVPTEAQRSHPDKKLSMCSQCQTFKPPMSHHCRICNRCISRMDHHCPWMNNCIGAGNLKHFLLFLMYTWTCATSSLLMLGWNYFFCADETCILNAVLTQLVRVMTLLSLAAFLFTSSMLMNVVYGILTGIGTIDRLKKKAAGTILDADEEPIPLTDIFGVGPYYSWPLPTDPIWEDYDRVMGYCTHQRLLREQMRRHDHHHHPSVEAGGGGGGAGSSVMGSSVVLQPHHRTAASQQQQYEQQYHQRHNEAAVIAGV